MRLQRVTAILVCAASVGGMWSGSALGAPTYCCASSTVATSDTSDALRALGRAVGSGKRCRPARCDCNGSGSVTVTDAIGILKVAVGEGSGSCSTTTTTLPPQCGNDRVDPGEDCEPPHSFCRDGCNPFTNLCVDLICSDACTCPPAQCGDFIIDAGESCDPPGSPCGTGTCDAGCGCTSTLAR